MSSHIFIRCVNITDAMSRKAKTPDKEVLFRARGSHSLASLSLMSAGEICVCFLVEILKTNRRSADTSRTCDALESSTRGAKASGCTTTSSNPTTRTPREF